MPTLVAYEATIKFGRQQGYPEENFTKNEKVLVVGTKSLEIAKEAGVSMAFGTDLIGELDVHQGGRVPDPRARSQCGRNHSQCNPRRR